MIKSLDEFLRKLSKAQVDTMHYLEGRMAGQNGPGTVGQLQHLLEYLQKVERNIRTGTIPSVNKRNQESLGWILVDNWDPNDPLGDLILEVDEYYLEGFS